MMRDVILYGALAKKYGKKHRFDVATPAEAVRALEANFQGFMSEMLALGERGYGYRIRHGKNGKVGVEKEDELSQPVSGSIHLIPTLHGAKKGGIGQILAAVVVIVAAIYMPGVLAGLGASAKTAGMVGTALMGAGISLALGGVIQLLSPQPKSSKPNENSREPSYIFDGPINTMAQGHPVPLGYGEMIIGSAVISAGIEVDELGVGDEPVAPKEQPQWTNPITGQVENYPPPTLAWDYNRDGWVTADGKSLLFDQSWSSGFDGSAIVRTNFRTSDGRVPYLNTAFDRWDIQNPTAFAVATRLKPNLPWSWRIGANSSGKGGVEIVFSTERKRWEVPMIESNWSGG